MADQNQKWSEALSELGAKLDELSAKASAAAETAKAAQQAKREEVDEKLRDAKGDFVALQERVREANERGQSKLFSELLKVRMTLEAKAQDAKEAKDKKRLERYITARIAHVADCYDAALFLISEANLAALEAVSATAEYEEKFGSKEES